MNWLHKNYATHSVVSAAHHNVITMTQTDTEVPLTFAARVEVSCDRMCSFFSAQDVKDVFINGLSDLVRPNVRALDSRFADQHMSEAVAAAQGFWEGIVSLRQTLKTNRTPLIKISQVVQQSPRTVEQPFVPIPTGRPVPPAPLAIQAGPKTNRPVDVCFNCQETGHWASTCPHPRREQPRRDRRTTRIMALIDDEARRLVQGIDEDEPSVDETKSDSDESKNE